MYKGASQAMQHAHGVDRPHPSRGYIDSGPDPDDVIASVAEMTIAELRQEQRQLRTEVLQAEQQIAIAKVAGTKAQREGAGQRKIVLTSRLSAINKALTARDEPNERVRIVQALFEVLPRDQADAVLARAKALREQHIGEPA